MSDVFKSRDGHKKVLGKDLKGVIIDDIQQDELLGKKMDKFVDEEFIQPSVVITYVNGRSHSFKGEDAYNVVRGYLYEKAGYGALVYTERVEPYSGLSVSMINWDQVMSWKVYHVGPEMFKELLNDVQEVLMSLQDNFITQPVALILPTKRMIEEGKGVPEEENVEELKEEYEPATSDEVMNKELDKIFQQAVEDAGTFKEGSPKGNTLDEWKEKNGKGKKKKEKNFLKGSGYSEGKLFGKGKGKEDKKE